MKGPGWAALRVKSSFTLSLSENLKVCWVSIRLHCRIMKREIVSTNMSNFIFIHLRKDSYFRQTDGQPRTHLQVTVVAIDVSDVPKVIQVNCEGFFCQWKRRSWRSPPGDFFRVRLRNNSDVVVELGKIRRCGWKRQRKTGNRSGLCIRRSWPSQPRV